MENETRERASSLRWKILRQALLRRPSSPNTEEQSQLNLQRISRKTTQGFNLIPSQIVAEDEMESPCPSRDVRVCYTLPINGAPKLFLNQRVENRVQLSDFEICNRYDIDNTGLVCSWPSEDVLAYFCLSHPDMFRSKRVIELGSGYGLAGFVISAITEAAEVVISDGNPQVVDYIQHNIKANASAFGDTVVKSMMLHWNEEEISNLSGSFDIIIASDCTFFKEFHKGLAQIVKCLLAKAPSSRALFFSPKRGDSLDQFLSVVKEHGLHVSLTEQYDREVWRRHQGLMNGEAKDSWPSYDKDHCYPFLVSITTT